MHSEDLVSTLIGLLRCIFPLYLVVLLNPVCWIQDSIKRFKQVLPLCIRPTLKYSGEAPRIFGCAFALQPLPHAWSFRRFVRVPQALEPLNHMLGLPALTQPLPPGRR